MLRPARRVRIVAACGCTLLLGIGIAAIPYNLPVGLAATILFCGLIVLFLVPLLHAASWTAEIDAEGFRVRDFFGRVRHRVAWEELEELFPIPGNGWKGPGTELLVAWRCRPRKRLGGLHFRWLAGTREADGHLPDTYGYDAFELIELMSRHAPSSHVSPQLSTF